MRSVGVIEFGHQADRFILACASVTLVLLSRKGCQLAPVPQSCNWSAENIYSDPSEELIRRPTCPQLRKC